ncbi:MAG: cytochrome c biogenesis protein CcsA [Bdellovibrionaceae bacterium]|nr:cytochrome c biogenesis protein CcsA [Pseudobdellovibrionaceae bacterium]
MKSLACGLMSLVLFLTPFTFAADGDALRSLPVQADGRVKPFDSFAREMLELIYGKQKFETRDAYEIILTWMLAPEPWQNRELFEVRNFEVLTHLGLDTQKRHYKGSELFVGPKFAELRQELALKRESKEKLTPYFQALQRLENQFFVFSEIATGRMIRLIPPTPGAESDAWVAIADMQGEAQEKFLDITKSFIALISGATEGRSSEDLSRVAKALDEKVLAFEAYARSVNPERYVDANKIKIEAFYNKFHPFKWSYIFYLLGAVVVLFTWITGKNRAMVLAWSLLSVGFVLHTAGFGIRAYLMERAPVTNMYETVVWVAWGSLVFAAILEKIYKFKFIIMAGGIIAAFGMIIADTAPVVLDPSLQPLEPVLRSNYWLTIHVMTITISYAAFFLAFALGDIGLFYFLKGEAKNKDKIRAIAMSIYRSIQIGVVFLAPGIILGGIWADYSWGRFWGWDPKETWALIVLLGYLAVIHGRLVGWVREFGMVVSGVITFALVIMAWYGVNFVLGAGLHSYGFGAGGVEYVSGFIVVHILLVVYAAVVRNARLKQAGS